ncbi:MAG: trehalose-phosphatase [Acidimicrobiales bacterium]
MDLLAPLRADPGRACLLCDCDGTLAPIVDDPGAAAPLPAAVTALHDLAGKIGRVGVVSGRPAAWLHDRFGDGLELSGLYGLERVEPDGEGRVVERPEAEPWHRVVAEVADRAEAAAPTGVLVERKGLSVTLHFRTAASHQTWVERFAEEQATVTGLEPSGAKSSVELRPPLPFDKGTAVRMLAEGFAVVVYVGDDAGDLPAFAVLDDLAAHGVATLKLVVASSELPEAVRAAADALVDGPAEVASLLSGLASSLP